MCGIVGIAQTDPLATKDSLLEGLKRLEYRGYDSAGIAVQGKKGLTRVRALGDLGALSQKVHSLQNKPMGQALEGNTGIGHTRWATHGAVTEANTHPHGTSRVMVVQNGIVENMSELKQPLLDQGIQFESSTDAELFSILVERALEKEGVPEKEALPLFLEKVLAPFEGSFAVLFLFADFPGLIVGYCQGLNTLILGQGPDFVMATSDLMGLDKRIKTRGFLESKDVAFLEAKRLEVFRKGKPCRLVMQAHKACVQDISLKGYPHFMLKEIYEQPKVIKNLLADYGVKTTQDFEESHLKVVRGPSPLSPEKLGVNWKNMSFLELSACGTAYYAGLLGGVFFEHWASLPVLNSFASELPFYQHTLKPESLFGVISQSGETADTLAALIHVQKSKQENFALLNIPESALGRIAQHVLPVQTGPEISVASTKAFMGQTFVLLLMALEAGLARGALSKSDLMDAHDTLSKLPKMLEKTLQCSEAIQVQARRLQKARSVVYLGRGPFYPLALEGALKLKEVAYLHAQGYAAGEIKHGPMALVEENFPMVILAPSGELLDKTLSNIQEVRARGADLIILTDAKAALKMTDLPADAIVCLPHVPTMLAPFVMTVGVQLLAYHTAALKGLDIDRPRNLAKSVTVQ